VSTDAIENAIRVLIVDDHPMVREGLRSMLGDVVEIVAEAGTGADALTLARARTPDLVLLDLELPDVDGLAVLRGIKEIDTRIAVLVVTMHDDARLVRGAVEAGAAGYVVRGLSRRELLAAVAAVRDGESVLEPRLLRALVIDERRGSASARDETANFEPLTPVEQGVLRLVAEGLTNRKIGERMRWSVGTAKKYVQRILEKLGASDRTQAAVVAVRRGLLG
jgi:DNA-binding NarL/FixJ family response regulator